MASMKLVLCLLLLTISNTCCIALYSFFLTTLPTKRNLFTYFETNLVLALTAVVDVGVRIISIDRSVLWRSLGLCHDVGVEMNWSIVTDLQRQKSNWPRIKFKTPRVHCILYHNALLLMNPGEHNSFFKTLFAHYIKGFSCFLNCFLGLTFFGDSKI